MLQHLYPLQKIIVHHFFEPLMDDKNLITQAQVARILFSLKIRDSIQTLLHQHPSLVSFTQPLVDKVKLLELILILFPDSLFRSSLPWSVSILNARLATPNAVAVNTELNIPLRL